MTRRSRILSLAAASALAVTLSPAAPAAAAPCASRTEIHSMIADLRADMRDDVKSRHARSATADAVHEVIATFRGAQADNPEERRILGREISAKLREMRAARNQVEKKALGLEVKALRQQRQPGKMSRADRARLKATFAALRSAVLGKAETRPDRRQLQRDIQALREQITC